MTATENLWPKILLNEVEKSPKSILNEQAKFLSDSTKNILNAVVVTIGYNDGNIEHTFDIIAPSLNGYRYSLMTISQQGFQLYPCNLHSKKTYAISNENDLLKKLKEIFSSDETKKIIYALISQSRDTNDVPF